MIVRTMTSISDEEKKRLKKSKSIRAGKRTAAINLDDAIERALAKDNN